MKILGILLIFASIGFIVSIIKNFTSDKMLKELINTTICFFIGLGIIALGIYSLFASESNGIAILIVGVGIAGYNYDKLINYPKEKIKEIKIQIELSFFCLIFGVILLGVAGESSSIDLVKRRDYFTFTHYVTKPIYVRSSPGKMNNEIGRINHSDYFNIIKEDSTGWYYIEGSFQYFKNADQNDLEYVIGKGWIGGRYIDWKE